MLHPFDYAGLPGRVLFGAGRVAEVAEEVRRLGCARALVVSTPRRRDADTIRHHLGSLAAGVFDGAAMHTPMEATQAALEVVRALSADCILAIGGGSAIGLAKAIALRTDLPQVAIPTTYAGSEVTPIVGETEGGVKTTQRTLKVLPEVVIYDVDLTLSLPPHVSGVSGINAIAHAVEALYARDRNPVMSLMAEEGIAALAASLPAILEHPEDRDARSRAQYGAWLCGICLGTVGMALHHKLCHVLGGAFNLPHAETHAVVLPHATAYNAAAAPEAMARIARAFGVRQAKDAPRALHDLGLRLGVPRGLKALGMPSGAIDRAAELALKNPYWNPRPLEPRAIRDLIARAHAGEAPQAG